MKRIILCFFALIFSTERQALDVDEKLTVRFLRFSSTKKTVLINRGLEDGLAEGDHAKFFVTSGVIARGLIVRVSPTRSIWSLYRVVEPATLMADRMANIKISTPIKLTDDPTRSFYGNDSSSNNRRTMPSTESVAEDLGDDAMGDDLSMEEDELDFVQEEEDGSETMSPSESSAKTYGILERSLFEASFLVNYNILRSDTSYAVEVEETPFFIDLSFELEKYFKSNGFLGNLSLLGLFHMGTQNSRLATGVESSVSFSEYGGGLRYHFLGNPRIYGSIIGFFSFTAGFVMTEDVLDNSSTQSTDAENGNPINVGLGSFYSFGTGIKYFFSAGLGLRVIIDYYMRNEQYEFVDVNDDYTRQSSGPRAQVGLSYRF